MVLIHTPYSSPRLNYVLRYIFSERLGLEYSTDAGEGTNKGFPVISYAENALPGSLHIKPHGLLTETGKTPVFNSFYTDPFRDGGVTTGSFPDIFSAVFYHLSRAEEYAGKRDIHGRYDYRGSSLYTAGLLTWPVLDLWTDRLKETLISHLGVSAGAFRQHAFRAVPGIDIDSVFAYLGKPWWRQAGALAKDLLAGRTEELTVRLQVLTGRKKDPNDNFSLQRQLLQGKTANYFIQTGDYGRFDRNVSYRNPAFRRTVRSLSDAGHMIGLHPSYASLNRPAVIREEKDRLEEMTGKEVSISRQHFLRFTLPDTYRILQECGIREDHSMGYSELPGFRAGTAAPFNWYDLPAERESGLRIHPFCVMDVAFKNFMGMNAAQTLEESETIRETCKSLKLPFTFVFHNESLSGHRGWENWETVFERWNNG